MATSRALNSRSEGSAELFLTLRKIFAVSIVSALSVLVLIFTTPSVSLASPQTDAARQQVDSTVKQMKEFVASQGAKAESQETTDKLREILIPIFDFEEMSRSSLGANWNKATPEQQQEFVQVFSDLLGHTYLDKIRKNIESSEITYLQPMTKGERVVIRSVVKTGADELSVDYRMYPKGSDWKIYDVVVESVGLVSNYRNEFASLLRKNNFEGLLAKLREQAASNKPLPAVHEK